MGKHLAMGDGGRRMPGSAVARRRSAWLMRVAAACGATALAGLTLIASSQAAAVCGSRRTAAFICAQFSYQTINDNADDTFNQLLGITANGQIAGYFGSGAQGHPNQGYLLTPQGGSYTQSGFALNNFPGSVQTQVTGLNNNGTLVGFYSTMNNQNQVNDNYGFYKKGGQFTKVTFPTQDNSSPPVNQLLGVNNKDVAVGFYTDAAGNSHGYFYNIPSGAFQPIKVPSDVTSDVATGVNDNRDISGFATTANGTTEGFLIHAGQFETINYPASNVTATQAFGVNNSDEVVGTYTTGSGNAAQMFGFTMTPLTVPGANNPTQVFQTISDPNGLGTTTANGIDACGNVVGFYVDGQGNTNGMFANQTGAAKPAFETANAIAARHKKPVKGKHHHHKHKKHKKHMKHPVAC